MQNGYRIWLGAGFELPIPPEKLKMKISGKNKEVILASGQAINLLKSPGLTEFSFEFCIPLGEQYPWQNAKGSVSMLDKLEKMKVEKQTFAFVVDRKTFAGKQMFCTSITAALEDYTVTEEGKNGNDIMVSVSLKTAPSYQTVKVSIDQKSKTVTTETKSSRPGKNPNTGKTSYTVQKGDSLYNIAKKYLGDGRRWKEIYNLNKDKIKNPNLIYAGQKLTLPKE